MALEKKTDIISAVEVHYLETVDSTNRYARDNYADLADLTLVVAGEQTAGRGRLNRRWLSPPGENIYASLLIKNPPFQYYKGAWFSSLAILALVRELAGGLEVWLKWPNDVYCGRRKLAGVLCESVLDSGNMPKGLIVGMGINVNSAPETLREVDLPATSIFCENKRHYNLKKVIKKLAIMLNKYYNISSLSEELLYLLWKKENKLIGQVVEFVDAQEFRHRGVVADIKESGEIVLEESGGGRKSYLCGDIRIDRRSISDSGPGFSE